MALQLIPKRRTLPNASLIQLLSTTSNSDDRNDQSKPSSSSYFSDVKASLRRQHQSTPPPPPRSPTGPSPPSHPSFSPPSKVASLEEIRKNLSEFRRRSAPDSVPTPSFQDLYKRNVLANAGNSNPDKSGGGVRISFDAIRESLRQMKPSDSARTDRGGEDSLSLSAFKSSSLRLKPMDSSPSPLPSKRTVIDATDALPSSLFGKEMKEGREGDGSSAMKTEFVKLYSHEELGEKLKNLRPEEKERRVVFPGGVEREVDEVERNGREGDGV